MRLISPSALANSIFGADSRSRLGILIGDDVLGGDALCLRIWDSWPSVPMRGVPDRFEWLGLRINVPDWMSREFRADGMIAAIA
jgi:hypothetical protein